MNVIFEDMGFNDESLKKALASIKARHDKSITQPDYMDQVREYRKAIACLQKAAAKLEEAIYGLPNLVKSSMLELPEGFRECLTALQGEVAVNFSSGPGNQLPSQKTIVKNRFVKAVAIEYRKQTGVAPGISISEHEKGGLFLEFLLAVAVELNVDSRGMVRRTQELIQYQQL